MQNPVATTIDTYPKLWYIVSESDVTEEWQGSVVLFSHESFFWRRTVMSAYKHGYSLDERGYLITNYS